MSIIQDFIREAGWPIFPTLAFGIAALAVSIKMIEKPTEQLASLVRNLSCLTLIFGVFGTIVGLQYSVSAIEKVEPAMRWIVLIGLGFVIGSGLVYMFVAKPYNKSQAPEGDAVEYAAQLRAKSHS